MDDVKICLLQKPDSPLQATLLSCLSLYGDIRRATQAEVLSGQDFLPPRAMVLWDLSLFSGREIGELAPGLAPERFGVVLASGAMDGEVLNACRLTGALVAGGSASARS